MIEQNKGILTHLSLRQLQFFSNAKDIGRLSSQSERAFDETNFILR